MDFDEIKRFIQQHFSDGLVIVVGSGLSAAEGIPGMIALAEHLKVSSSELKGDDLKLWQNIAGVLDKNQGLEAALLKYAPSSTLETWIVKKTCDFLLPKELAVFQEVVGGHRTLRLTSFLLKVLKPPNGLPILSTNYDRLIELGCEIAGFHVDTTAIGHYAASFDHTKSFMGACRGIVTKGKIPALDYFPRALVLKPHGSFDWYRSGSTAIRSSIPLNIERLIITPGLNKYKTGYQAPFDKHRELANNHINQAARFLIIGYGFNDDHLQTHLIPRIRSGIPTLILVRTANQTITKLASESPKCICLSAPATGDGVKVTAKGVVFEDPNDNLWDLGVLTKVLLS